MHILVLNGSPKGKNSVTLQTMLFFEKTYPQHTWEFQNVGQKIKAFEKDFTPLVPSLQKADLIFFAYPVYTFIAPYQIHRLMELIKESKVDLRGKWVSQVSTSKHFYDVTAHAYIEENCQDMGMRILRGLSADMDDLLSEKGQKQAIDYFDELLFHIDKDIEMPYVKMNLSALPSYERCLAETPKTSTKDVVIVTNYAKENSDLIHMIEDFRATFPHPTRIVNLREFPFSGGCLGCFGCAITGKCVYKDNFDTFLRENIQKADAIVYAFNIENHYTHSSFKQYDDRQFCNGHRMVTMGMPVGYLISGHYQAEHNLKTIVEARSEVGHVHLAGVATNEQDTKKSIQGLSDTLDYALSHKPDRPQSFWGVGGTKIFRDLIYIMQGMMKADHQFYKAHGIYDFPQKQKARILQMKLVGALISVPSMQKKMKGQMNQYIIGPYQKVIEKAKPHL